MNRKALVVGIDEYRNSKLDCCVKDAKDIAQLLKANEDRTPNFEVRTLLSSNNDVNRKLLREAIKTLFEDNKDVDISLLYFSGHGTSTDLGGYIVTSDAEEFDEGISIKEIVEIANQSAIRNKIIILDCCSSGVNSNAKEAKSVVEIAEGVTILTSSSNSGISEGGAENSLFTSLMISALEGECADLLGNILPSNIYAYIDRSLGYWGQRPTFMTNVSSFTPIRQVNPVVDINILRNIVEYFPDPHAKYDLSPEYEPTEISAKEDKVTIFGELQCLTRSGLVRPSSKEHMYYEAMESGTCQLTKSGQLYWKLMKNGRA